MSTCYKILDQSLPHFLKLQLCRWKTEFNSIGFAATSCLDITTKAQPSPNGDKEKDRKIKKLEEENTVLKKRITDSKLKAGQE